MYYYHLLRFQIVNQWHLRNVESLKRSSERLLEVRRILRFQSQKKNINKSKWNTLIH